tara:strand:- start:50 stop:292 length:243 start_codon:yes stop_codon:yes gene_type:complete
MTDIAVGVLIPNRIDGEHNEIIDIWILDNKYYYYQCELTEEGSPEGIYDNNNNLMEDDKTYEDLENATFGIESLSFTAIP